MSGSEHGVGPTAVLVPAAGSGTRLGGERKQFRTLGGRPLLVRTLEIFERHPDVDHLVVAAPSGEVAGLEAHLREAGLSKLHRVVAGGATRQDSVGAALAALDARVEVVLVHDAVRPFVTPDAVARIIEAVSTYGAAALAVPVADTLRRVEHGRFAETVAREGLVRMQTPQGARRDWFEAAHERARVQGLQATDDVALVQALGHPVHLVAGDARNLKITTPGDWALARLLWAERS